MLPRYQRHQPDIKSVFRIVRVRLFVTVSLVFCLVKISFAEVISDTASIQRGDLRWILSLDSRSTIIQHRHIGINGVLGGIGFGEKYHKITVGYYWLNYGSQQRLLNLHKNLAHSLNLSVYTKTDVQFVSVAYWFPILHDKKWIVSVPIEMGIGQESAHYRQVANDGFVQNKNFHFEPCQIGVYGEYRLTPWASIDTQAGYRDAIYKGAFRKHFKGLYYSYGATLYPETIYKDLKKKFSHQ